MNDYLPFAEDILGRSEVLVDEAGVIACYERLAAAITEDFYDKDPVIICVMLGALHVTAEVTKRLKFPFELDYLHATRYQGETSGGDLVWKVSPSLNLTNRHVLVIDDILDEGHTLASILKSLEQQQPAQLSTAVLVDKQHDRRDPRIQADYVGVKLQDRYLIGCGMDFRNYYRQLPYIAAVKVL